MDEDKIYYASLGLVIAFFTMLVLILVFLGRFAVNADKVGKNKVDKTDKVEQMYVYVPQGVKDTTGHLPPTRRRPNSVWGIDDYSLNKQLHSG